MSGIFTGALLQPCLCSGRLEGCLAGRALLSRGGKRRLVAADSNSEDSGGGDDDREEERGGSLPAREEPDAKPAAAKRSRARRGAP